MNSRYEDLAADCTCTFSMRRHHKKEEREDERGIHIPLCYVVESQKTEEEKKLERKKINFRRRGYLSEKE